MLDCQLGFFGLGLPTHVIQFLELLYAEIIQFLRWLRKGD